MSVEYSFKTPGKLIWIAHMAIGAFLAYIGYCLLNNKKVSQTSAVVLVSLGSLVILYHGHLMFYYSALSGGTKIKLPDYKSDVID